MRNPTPEEITRLNDVTLEAELAATDVRRLGLELRQRCQVPITALLDPQGRWVTGEGIALVPADPPLLAVVEEGAAQRDE